MKTTPALKSARCRTALMLRGVELPECMMNSTLASLVNAVERKADRKVVRRLSGKVVRLGMAQP